MQVYLYNTYSINTTSLRPRHVDGTSYCSHGYVQQRRFGGANVVMRMGAQQQHSNQDRYVNEVVPPRTFSLVLNLKFGHKLLLSLSAKPDNVLKSWKIIAKTLCFMHQSIFRPIYIFNNPTYFLVFRAQVFPLVVFNLNLLIN